MYKDNDKTVRLEMQFNSDARRTVLYKMVTCHRKTTPSLYENFENKQEMSQSRDESP